jgi:hypothetical protein
MINLKNIENNINKQYNCVKAVVNIDYNLDNITFVNFCDNLLLRFYNSLKKCGVKIGKIYNSKDVTNYTSLPIYESVYKCLDDVSRFSINQLNIYLTNNQKYNFEIVTDYIILYGASVYFINILMNNTVFKKYASKTSKENYDVIIQSLNISLKNNIYEAFNNIFQLLLKDCVLNYNYKLEKMSNEYIFLKQLLQRCCENIESIDIFQYLA